MSDGMKKKVIHLSDIPEEELSDRREWIRKDSQCAYKKRREVIKIGGAGKREVLPLGQDACATKSLIGNAWDWYKDRRNNDFTERDGRKYFYRDGEYVDANPARALGRYVKKGLSKMCYPFGAHF